MTETTRSRRRILIGAGSFADAETALWIADRLSDAMIADLGGLLVEDADAFNMPGGPHQRIVTSTGSVVIAPSRDRLHLMLASDARAFRTRLERLARTRSLRCTFERRSGELVSGLCQAAESWDVLVVGYRRTHRGTGRVVVVQPEASNSDEATALSDMLSKALHADVVTIRPDVAERGGSPEALFSKISRINAAVVVADLTTGPVTSIDQLRRLLDAARAPVLVVGASSVLGKLEHTAQIPPAPAQ